MRQCSSPTKHEDATGGGHLRERTRGRTDARSRVASLHASFFASGGSIALHRARFEKAEFVRTAWTHARTLATAARTPSRPPSPHDQPAAAPAAGRGRSPGSFSTTRGAPFPEEAAFSRASSSWHSSNPSNPSASRAEVSDGGGAERALGERERLRETTARGTCSTPAPWTAPLAASDPSPRLRRRRAIRRQRAERRHARAARAYRRRRGASPTSRKPRRVRDGGESARRRRRVAEARRTIRPPSLPLDALEGALERRGRRGEARRAAHARARRRTAPASAVASGPPPGRRASPGGLRRRSLDSSRALTRRRGKDPHLALGQLGVPRHAPDGEVPVSVRAASGHPHERRAPPFVGRIFSPMRKRPQRLRGRRTRSVPSRLPVSDRPTFFKPSARPSRPTFEKSSRSSCPGARSGAARGA